jgi:intergrase/recombinase
LNPGHGLDRPPAKAPALNSVSPAMESGLDSYYVQAWETWCLERGTSPETCAKYASYLERPLDPGNRWSAKAWKLYYRWRCELGDQTACEDYKRLRVPQAGADLRVPSLEAILGSIERAGPYRLVYMILLESGLRLVEAVRLLRERPRLECVGLDGFERCLLGRERGKKRSLWAYHITPIDTPIEGLTDRRVTSYAEKYRLVPPKYVRKFVATKMAELEIPPHVIDFIQGRAPRSVLEQHYAQLLGLADRHYATYAAWLRRVYKDRLGGGGG